MGGPTGPSVSRSPGCLLRSRRDGPWASPLCGVHPQNVSFLCCRLGCSRVLFPCEKIICLGIYLLVVLTLQALAPVRHCVFIIFSLIRLLFADVDFFLCFFSGAGEMQTMRWSAFPLVFLHHGHGFPFRPVLHHPQLHLGHLPRTCCFFFLVFWA